MSETIALKFLFANHDGVYVELTVPYKSTGQQVKEKLMASWPNGKVDPSTSGTKGIRLLAMGRMLDDAKTLEEMKIQRFDHPTPVNVSLLPHGKAYSETLQDPSAKSEKKPTPSSGEGCCTIS